MKNLILIALLLTFLRASAAVTLMVQTNGALAGPTNFFTANSNAVTSAAVGKLSKTGDSISGTFAVTNSDLTFDGYPGGGSGYASYTNSVYFNDLASFELGQVGNTYLDAISDTTIRGQSNLWILAPQKLFFLTPEIAGFSVGTNAVPVLTDPTTGEVKFTALETLKLGSTVTSGKVLGKSSTSKSIVSGSVDVTDVASAATLGTVSNTATAALPKAGGTMTGALVLAANASAALNPVTYQQLRSTNNIVAWAAATAYQPSGTITRDGNGIITSMAVKWPDGATGLFTGTANTSGYGVDAYTLTYILSGTTNTVTQATVTRDGSGNVTTAPTLTFQ
jgi:hypothetical protein